MENQRVLVIEDDEAVRRGVIDALTFSGYRTSEANRGDTGLKLALSSSYDLLLLDLVLPEMGGLEILQEVRQERPTTPVIILTAKGEEVDRVRGLQLGADDYVVKPFSVRELTARIQAVLRRSPERPDDISEFEIPGGVIDLKSRELRFEDGGRSDLSEREIDLLRYLAGHAGRAISREELMNRVWNLDPKGLSTRTIDMHIARLREKLRDDPSEPTVIRTVRGKGYMYLCSGATT